MKNKEITEHLKKIYKELDSWSEVNKKLNYNIPPDEIRRREAVLITQQVLYQIQEAKKLKDKTKEYCLTKLFESVKHDI
jgi:hypothetical protein